MSMPQTTVDKSTEILASGRHQVRMAFGVGDTFTPVVYKRGLETGVGLMDPNGTLVYRYDGPYPSEFLLTSYRAMKLLETMGEINGPGEVKTVWHMALSAVFKEKDKPPSLKEEYTKIGKETVRTILNESPTNLDELLGKYTAMQCPTIANELAFEIKRGKIQMTPTVAAYFERVNKAVADFAQETVGMVVTVDEAVERLKELDHPAALRIMECFRKSMEPEIGVLHREGITKEVYLIGRLGKTHDVVATLCEAVRPGLVMPEFGTLLALERNGSDLSFRPPTVKIPPIMPERKSIGSSIRGLFKKHEQPQMDDAVRDWEFTIGKKRYGAVIRAVSAEINIEEETILLTFEAEINDTSLRGAVNDIIQSAKSVLPVGIPPSFASAWEEEERHKDSGFA